MPFFEDLDLGDEIGPLEIEASDAQVATFCGIWDRETPSRFTDPEMAKKTGLPGPIVPGIMSMAFLSQLITDWAPNVSLKKLDVIFRAPVKHKEPINCRGLVTDKEVRDGEQCVECDLYIETQQGLRAVTGKAIVMISSH